MGFLIFPATLIGAVANIVICCKMLSAAKWTKLQGFSVIAVALVFFSLLLGVATAFQVELNGPVLSKVTWIAYDILAVYGFLILPLRLMHKEKFMSDSLFSKVNVFCLVPSFIFLSIYMSYWVTASKTWS